MAMPEDVGEELDLLRRVFPKWRVDNILNYLLRTRPENRVKNAICKYIQSHDSHLNRNDCETDAKLVHEVFPDVPFADIFTRITMLGDERNRVRICLRLLLFENGFKTSNNSGSDLINEIDSEDIKDMLHDHKNLVGGVKSTALTNIRNKYRVESNSGTIRNVDLHRAAVNHRVDSDSEADVVIKRDKVILSESPVGDANEPKLPTRKESQNSSFNNSEAGSTEKSTESSEMFSKTSPKKDRKFSIDLEQLEDFFNNSNFDFSGILAPVEVARIKNIQADQINLSTNNVCNEILVSVNKDLKQCKDSIICKNPFEDCTDFSNKKHEFIDLTNKSSMWRKRSGKPCTVTSTEIINLDNNRDFNSDVIIEDTRLPEPIVEETDIIILRENTSQRKKQRIIDKSAVINVVEEFLYSQPVPGPSGINLSKRKPILSTASGEDNSPPKKSKIDNDLMNLEEIFDESMDAFLDKTLKKNKNTEKKENTSLRMYEDFIEKKRSILTSASDVNFLEDISDTEIGEEEFVVDEALYFPLMEIFPEACPIFLKRMCNGKVNNPGQINSIISEVLDICDYPKRKKPEEVAPNEINEDDQFEILIQVLPDADPMYLKKKIEEFGGDSECIKEFINDAMETKSYPTLKEYQRKQQLSTQTKQYTSDFKVEKYLEQIPDPETYFKDKIYNEFSYEERDYLQLVLKNVFNMLPIKVINTKLNNLKSVTDIFDSLHHVARKANNHMKSRRKFSPYDTVLQNIPFLQEIAYNVNRPAIVNWRASRAKLLQDQREQHRTAGLLQTCCCCYDDTLLPEEVVQCETGCDSCMECVQRSTEVIFGQGRTDFPCIGGCGKEYSMRILQDALSKKLFSKVAQKRQLAEVRAAGLEDLEQCPFCDFANIPSREDRLFRCFNPECMKESCRKCKELNHIPLRCEEVEKDADVQARVQIENKMTEALLRSCWKCQTKFIKSDGCNKMTCPKCGSFSCYICGKSVKDYKHFNGQGGDRFDLCPLYSDTNKLHEEAVLKAAEDAKKGLDQNALKLDPTADIQKHFEEYNKNNPVVLPPGIRPQEQQARQYNHVVLNQNQYRDAGNADRHRLNIHHYPYDAFAQHVGDIHLLDEPRPPPHPPPAHQHQHRPHLNRQHRQMYRHYRRLAGQNVNPWLPNQNLAADGWRGFHPQRNVDYAGPNNNGRMVGERLDQLRDIVGLLPRDGAPDRPGHGAEPGQRDHI